MPYDSNGVAVVAGNRPVNGQDTDAAQINVPLADIQAMLSQVLLKSGVAPVLGNLNMNGFKIANIGTATDSGDLITLGELNSTIANQGVPAGSVYGFRRKAAPSGWVVEDGGSIGNAASGATTRANDDTLALYTVLWTEFSNSELTIQTNGGVNTSRGSSAANDFAANKRMPLFDSRSRFHRGSDSGLGYDASLTVGVTQADLIKTHTHSGNTGNHHHDIPLATDVGTGDLLGFRRVTTPTTTPFITSNETAPFTSNTMTGGGTETRPRSSVVLYCIKL
ncbi:hypothetical protein EON76_05310 [bacterium]|nr:MAG: hypothetical protein EON76_05310 [bacterium]